MYVPIILTQGQSTLLEKAKINIAAAQEKQWEHYNWKHANLEALSRANGQQKRAQDQQGAKDRRGRQARVHHTSQPEIEYWVWELSLTSESWLL